MPNSQDTNSSIYGLLSDKAVARILSISPSWIRKQRLLRRRGQDHCLDIEPIMIGSVPRYVFADVAAWIAAKRKVRVDRPSEEEVGNA